MYTIDRTGAWRLYEPNLPSGATALGTIRRANGESGALIQFESGIYAQANAGVIRTLDQGAVTEALRTADAAGGAP